MEPTHSLDEPTSPPLPSIAAFSSSSAPIGNRFLSFMLPARPLRFVPLARTVSRSARHRVRRSPQAPTTTNGTAGPFLRTTLAFISAGTAATVIMSKETDLKRGKSQSELKSHENRKPQSELDSYEDRFIEWAQSIRLKAKDVKRQVVEAIPGENHRVLAGVIAINIGVWGLWQISSCNPAFHRFMWRHFTCSYENVVKHKRVHTLITAELSHMSTLHLAVNMLMLWDFGSQILKPQDQKADPWLSRITDTVIGWFSTKHRAPELLTIDQFMAMYVSSAVTSSAFSIVASRLRGFPTIPTIGASGAGMAVFSMFCLLFPERPLFLFSFYEMSNEQTLQLSLAINLIGSIFQRGGGIDHFAHLGGLLSGSIAYEHLGERATLNEVRS